MARLVESIRLFEFLKVFAVGLLEILKSIPQGIGGAPDRPTALKGDPSLLQLSTGSADRSF